MPSSHPQLFIVAGPNGAGKSTTSEKLLKPFKNEGWEIGLVYEAGGKSPYETIVFEVFDPTVFLDK